MLCRGDLADRRVTYEDNSSESRDDFDDIDWKAGLLSHDFKLWKPPHQKNLSKEYFKVFIKATAHPKLDFVSI
jgi:hypothetical protein